MILIPLGLIASKTAVSKAFGEIFVLFKNTDKRRDDSLIEYGNCGKYRGQKKCATLNYEHILSGVETSASAP